MIFREDEELVYGASFRFFPETEQNKDNVFFSEDFFEALSEHRRRTNDFLENRLDTKLQAELFVLDKSIEGNQRKLMGKEKYIKTITVFIVDGNLLSLMSKKFKNEFYKFF